MRATYQPEPHPVRKLDGACLFCNEALVEVWCDPSRAEAAYQVRCAMCGARGPWGEEGGAVEAWRSVAPIER